ncbi:MAG: hypothetical protein IRZ23_05500 [Acetobacteraceae bacterium]|nr:hypothetical protein [Acetobacteraceae bacterium]
MITYPAVMVHGVNDALAALAPGLPVTLLSAPGAGCFMGAGFWRALVAAATKEYPATPCQDVLDCADAPGRALEALRMGQKILVLWPEVPGWQAAAEAARACNAVLLAEAPPALDLARPGALRRLPDWLNRMTGQSG